MCTVVVAPSGILALRDELVGRDFDDPGAWWPEQPTVVGGRDRAAGGTWCATDVATGRTALVLNRPQRRLAAPGAPSRGVLPLLALRHGADWSHHVGSSRGPVGMASFALLLVRPPDADQPAASRADARADRSPDLGTAAVDATLWLFDGERLTSERLTTTTMVTSGGDEDGKAARHLEALRARPWTEVLAEHAPTDDPTALTVRHRHQDQVFATVFGSVIRAREGSLELRSSRTPWLAGSWRDQRF